MARVGAAGNSIIYSYDRSQAGEHHVSSITYTGRGTTAGDRSVAFTWEARSDLSTDYINNSRGIQTKRLKQINTSVAGAAVREYRMYYGNDSLSTQRTLLVGVEECAVQGASTYCLPKTEFTWSNPPVSFGLPAGYWANVDEQTRKTSDLAFARIDVDSDPLRVGMVENPHTANPSTFYEISPGASFRGKDLVHLVVGKLDCVGVVDQFNWDVVHSDFQWRVDIQPPTKLVTTKDRNALGRYLSEKGLDLQDTSLAILDWYVGREYTFVVSYASESVASGLSVFVSLPTDKIYFPLKLTSVYGSRRIPISLLVKGHARPNLAAKIRRGSSVKYLAGTYEFTRRIPEPFWRGGTYFVDFTRIEIDTASKNLHDDLWMRDSPPLRIRLLRLPSWFTAALVIFSYAAFSMLASWAAGRVSFKEDPPPAWKLLLVGLANFLTMLVFIPTALASQKKGRRRDFILRFYLYFLGLLGGGTGLLWLWYS